MGRAVANLDDGRILEVSDGDNAEFFMRDGVAGFSMMEGPTFWSEPNRRVECIFDNEGIEKLPATPEGPYHVKLRSFDEESIVLGCRPATLVDLLCARHPKWLCF